MTRHDAINRIKTLEARKIALEDQLLDVDAQSATISSDGGSRSYTNRAVSDIKTKIAYCNREIARLRAKLDGMALDAPKTVKVVLG